MRRARERIADIKESGPGFHETIEALEFCDEEAEYAAGIFYSLLSAQSDDERHELARQIGALRADFSNDVLLDEKLFDRVRAVYDRLSDLNLPPEERKLTVKKHDAFVRNGALLPPEKKEELRAIDRELSALGPQFGQNVLKATSEFTLVIRDESDLSGLPDTVIEGAAEEARKRGEEGAWVFTLHAPCVVPFLTYADHAGHRETLWRAYSSRAYSGEHSNQSIAREIAKLREDRAKLLGFKTHADFVLAERMARSPENVYSFLDRLKGVYLGAAQHDLAELQHFRKELDGSDVINSWDYAYYREKLKKRRFGLDQEELRPWFPLETVLDGLFEFSGRLFEISFENVTESTPLYDEDVRVFAVSDEDGEHLGLLYFDFFPRDNKKAGAWMTTFRDQGYFGGRLLRPHVSIVCNFTEPHGGKEALLTYDEVRTLFHEFGHAIHALFSKCKYRSLSGTSVYWDFVELPSQIMENWLLEPEALEILSGHHETGEPLPADIVARIQESAHFFSGSHGLRQLGLGYLDMAWHAREHGELSDIDEFEHKATAETQLLPRVPGTNVSCSFLHIFMGGYASGYYSYKWSEVLDADAYELFKKHGVMDRGVAESFRREILEKGGTEDPTILYKRFRGADPDPDALLRREGLL